MSDKIEVRFADGEPKETRMMVRFISSIRDDNIPDGVFQTDKAENCSIMEKIVVVREGKNLKGEKEITVELNLVVKKEGRIEQYGEHKALPHNAKITDAMCVVASLAELIIKYIKNGKREE